MFFLQGLFDTTESIFGDTINHFPLIELIFQSLDRTLIYFLVWLIGRFAYLSFRKRKDIPFNIRREALLNSFVFYVVLLIHLTVFREGISIREMEIVFRSLSEINWIPFLQTIKLAQGSSTFAFYYNLYGNILWFIPMGFCASYLMKEKHTFIKPLLIGFSVSLSIETLQFLFWTGITDIDDLIFNTVGTMIGILLFKLLRNLQKKRASKKTAA